MMTNPSRFIAEVEGMSVFLRHRQIDPMYERIKHMDRAGYEGIIKKIGEVGMKGLEWADRWTVAVGWKAVYNKARLDGAPHEEAVETADDVVLKTQPSARGVDLSPLFRDNNEWKRIVTQFGTALNVVFQQAYFDSPAALRDGKLGEGVGIIMTTMLAGLALGAIKKLRGKDEPDEDEAWWQDWLYYSISQYPESLPLVGGLVSGTMKRLVANGRSFTGGDEFFPALENILTSAGNLATREVESFAEFMDRGKGDMARLAEGIGLAAGLPTLAVEEYLGWLFAQGDK